VTTGRTPQQTLAAVYDEGAAAYEKYWAPVLHRHALDLVNTVTSATAPAPRIVVDESSLLTAVTGCFVAYHHRCPGCRPTPQHCHFVRRRQTS